ARGITIQGSYLGSCVTQRDVPRFIQLHREGHLPTDKLISHHIQLGDINAALDRLADGEALRQVIEF
ncbi:MAG: alcohol dehydrogenase, partial [Acidobacteria bacterium]|nr:alcohol dehydrogenase [Acidobacteriota bacterium]